MRGAIHVAEVPKAVPERRDAPEIAAGLTRRSVAPAIGAYGKAMG